MKCCTPKKPACCGIGYKSIPAALGDDTGEFKPENGAYHNMLIRYEENGALYLYTNDGIFTQLDGERFFLMIEKWEHDTSEELEAEIDQRFSDLNVQNEIDHKLNEMVADGTLAEIIDAYLQTNVAWVFDTVEDMKAAENLVNGSYARTLGFHAINDGGGALYYITDSGTANEMNVIAVNDLYANLVSNGYINVKQYGAYGDGATNESTILNAIIGLANINDTIYFPVGEYKLNSTLTINKNVNIKCDGTIISNGTKPLLYFNGVKDIEVDINKLNEITTQDVTFSQNEVNNAAIVLKNCMHIKTNVQEISNFVIAMMLIGDNTQTYGGSYYNTTSIKHIDSCFHGIVMFAGSGGAINGNIFDNLEYDYHTWSTVETPYFIQIKNISGNTYYNNANNFYKLQAEYGVSGEGGPKLLNIQNGQNNFFEFDRIEIASDSYQEPFVFAPTNARCNQVEVKFMTKSFTFSLTSDRNIIHCPVQYGNTNHQNNVKDITSTLTLAENVTMPQGKVFVDYIHQLVYINITLQSSAVISANTSLVTGLPTPIEHVMMYERYATSTNLYTKSSDDTVLYISRSLVPSTIVNRTTISTNSTVNINVVYKMGSW